MNAGGFFGGNRVECDRPSFACASATRSASRLELGFATTSISLEAASSTNLARARLSYSFSPRVFVQSLVQYNDRANTWSSNFRFGWLQQANTGVFVVYTDSHLLDESPFRPSNADRSFIVKISRMFDALR